MLDTQIPHPAMSAWALAASGGTAQSKEAE